MIGIKRNGCVCGKRQFQQIVHLHWASFGLTFSHQCFENIDTRSGPHVLQVKARSEKEIFRFLAADFVLWLGVVNSFRAFLSIAFVAMQHAIVQTGYGLLCRAQEHLAWNTWIPRRDDIQGISYTILRVFESLTGTQ